MGPGCTCCFDIINARVSKLDRGKLFSTISVQLGRVIRHDDAMLSCAIDRRPKKPMARSEVRMGRRRARTAANDILIQHVKIQHRTPVWLTEVLFHSAYSIGCHFADIKQVHCHGWLAAPHGCG